MAMQSSGAAKHGVIQSSIALLQERFRQLQREKEMRERRQLLRNNNSNFMSPSDSELGNYHLTINSHYNDHFKLVFSDEAAAMRPPEISPASHHHPVSLSLWPSESYLDGGSRGEKVPALIGAKEKDYTGLYSSYGCLGLSVNCDDFHASDVDTSLHL